MVKTMDYILATKLLIPEAPAQFIVRQRLLPPVALPRLTLVCAPAGYGKTTLISAWARTAPGQNAWLSLDAGDNDPAQFMMHLISAIQTCFPAFAQTTATMLASTQLSSINGISRSLLNELCQLGAHLQLFIDDLHYIHDPQIQQALAFIIEHQPPQLHLVIASRNLPPFSLSRLRAQRQLNELYTEDLRFNREEINQFCLETMQLDLSPPLLDALEVRTEGWIVGLQLAALSLQNTGDKPSFIHSFAGDDRHITDFLMEEVLNLLSADTQHFLLQTCLLQQFSAPLCDAVRLQHDSRERIDELERSNLFISRLDHKRVWYRYHHLFASLLQSRLQQLHPEQITGLHHRASLWFKEHGQLNEAIQHGIKAGDYDAAAEMMEEHSSTLFSLGRFTTALTWAYQLPAEVLAKHPKLTMLCAWAGLVMDNLPEVERHVRAATACLEQYRDAPCGSKERAMFGQLALIRSCQYCLMGDVERAEASVLDALGSLSPKQVLYRGASVCLGFCYYAQGDLDKAIRLFEENARISDAKYNLMVPVFATLGLARSLLLRGQMAAAKAVYDQALHDCHSRGWQAVPVCGMLYLGLGELMLDNDELTQAHALLAKGLELTTAGQMQYITAWGRVLLAQVDLALGRANTLSGAEEAALQCYSGRFVVEIPPLSATLASLWLQQGRMDAVASWLKAAQLPPAPALAFEREAEYLVLVRYLLACKRLAEAADLLSLLWRHAEPRHRLRSLIEILVLKTVLLQLDNQPAKAQAALQHALTLAGDQTCARLFRQDYDHLAPLLARLGHPLADHLPLPVHVAGHGQSVATAAPGAGYLLSRKERQVARHIVTGATSQEIAESLCVSLSTIKTHTQNIYAKLGVNKRLQAIELLLKLNLA